jgi:hypothetical protein
MSMHPALDFCSINPEADYLKFIHKVKDHKMNAKVNF